jgi:hypothetical protein
LALPTFQTNFIRRIYFWPIVVARFDFFFAAGAEPEGRDGLHLPQVQEAVVATGVNPISLFSSSLTAELNKLWPVL